MSHISVKKKSGSDFPKLKQERRTRMWSGGREGKTVGAEREIRYYSEAFFLSSLKVLPKFFIMKFKEGDFLAFHP